MSSKLWETLIYIMLFCLGIENRSMAIVVDEHVITARKQIECMALACQPASTS